MNKIKLIINADDLGGSQKINDAVFELLEKGRITSATIMANGPAFEDAVTRSQDYPSASFGVHLNLTQFHPLSGDPGLKPVLDTEGKFTQRIFDIRWPGPGLAKAIESEWSAQIARVREAGVPVSHIDSHQHVHTLPANFPIVKKVQFRNGISKLRNTKNLYCNSSPPRGRFLVTQKKVWSAALRGVVRTRTTDKFCDYATFVEAVQDGDLESFETAEAMVHPGSTDSDSLREIELLNSDVLKAFPIDLISWRDII